MAGIFLFDKVKCICFNIFTLLFFFLYMTTSNTSFSNAFLPNLKANTYIDITKWQAYKSNFYESPYKVLKKWIKGKARYHFWNILYTTAKKCEYYALMIEATKPKGNEEKFNEIKILMLSTLIPDDIPKTILWVSEYYPTLSKRQVCKILEEIKWNYPTWFKNVRWIDE